MRFEAVDHTPNEAGESTKRDLGSTCCLAQGSSPMLTATFRSQGGNLSVTCMIQASACFTALPEVRTGAVEDERGGEAATLPCVIAATPQDKEGVLRKCFTDAAEKIAAVVHGYFPKLLGVAFTMRQYLQIDGKNVEPSSWTAAQIREQACNLLGMACNSEDVTIPRHDSLVIEATRRILCLASCLPEKSTDELLLPWWADGGLLHAYAWGRLANGSFVRDATADHPFVPPSGDETECMSSADTLEWIGNREREIRQRLERQIADEIFDAAIDAGRTGISVRSWPSTVEVKASGHYPGEFGNAKDEENRFVKDGQTWHLAFAGEICRLGAPLIGLDYISVLLRTPCKALKAVELQSRVSGQPFDTRFAELAQRSISEETEDAAEYGEGIGVPQQDFSRVAVLDQRARAEYEAKLREIEDEATLALEVGDRAEAEKLQKEYDAIDAEIRGSTGMWHRSRNFPNRSERARQSVTKAIKRAYEKIGAFHHPHFPVADLALARADR